MYGNNQSTINNPPVYNVNTTHPLIQNSQEYLYYKKYISIHSQDRNMLKYPNASEFEIELPEDYLNVSSLRLVQWTFPSNYNTFSNMFSNVSLSFKIIEPYNPIIFDVDDDYTIRIFKALYESDRTYSFSIEDGFYNPSQITIELTNKFNSVVSTRIEEYFVMKIKDEPDAGWNIALEQFRLTGGYQRFIIVYNNVSQKIWFGNQADSFELVNSLGSINTTLTGITCDKSVKQTAPEFANYGLPSNLGLKRSNETSTSKFKSKTDVNYSKIGNVEVPRFFYGDVIPGDNGYWLLPLNFDGCLVNWIEASEKLNIMGDAFLYMEIAKNNCIDETQPYNVSNFTNETNNTNGVVNSAFSKLPIPATPLSQWFDRDSLPYMFYYPPAERIRKLSIKIRYHNGQLARFGNFNYSFMLEFTLMIPQMLRNENAIAASTKYGR
jgi:hypothetical protein